MAREAIERPSKFGWLCSYTPIEILVAAGFKPIRLDAGDKLLHKANPHIYQLLCPYIRAVFDAALGDDFGPLHGVVFMKCCDAMLRLYDLWKVHLPVQKTYVLPLPKIQSAESIDYLARALGHFAHTLGEDFGHPVGEDALRSAIADYNRLRSSVQSLYQFRLKKPQSMPYSELRLRIGEWLSIAPSEALMDVERLLVALNDIQSEESNPESHVLLSSSTLDQISLIRLIEEAGMTVVADDHCSGLRHFDDLVLEEGDLYLNLAKRYLERWPCARMQSDPSHLKKLVQEVERTNAKGVIYVGLKYCDQAGFEVPRIQAQLKERDIPFLYIENDYTAVGLGQLKVRIEAFAEMLKEDFLYAKDL